MNLSIDSSEFYSDNQTSPDSIKKRLNLHVKRRLLEQATTSQQGSAITSPQVVSSIPTATIVQAANFSPPVVPPKEPRKYKSQKKQPAGTDNPPPDSPGAKKKCTRKSTSVIKRTQDVQNDEMNDEDFAMAEVHPSENDQSMSSHAAMEATGETKTPHTLDILSIVLNEKKAALMNDPEIIRFLAGISMKLMEQQHQQPQQPQQTQQSQQPQPPQQPQQTQQTQQPQQLQQPQQPQQPRQPQQRNVFNRWTAEPLNDVVVDVYGLT